jgi:transketolase
MSVNPMHVRETILNMLYDAGASHLGSSMSLVEILVAAYGSVDIDKIRKQTADRSRVFVSKGHGACATYATMYHFGLLQENDIKSYHKEKSLLAGHVSHSVPCVEHSTGALGHGLPVAAGCALGLKSKGFDNASAFVVLGDGELQEGSNWEALMFAHHQSLSNLIPIVDCNKISSITYTNDVINMCPLSQRFEGFGFRAFDVDGHDLEELSNAIETIRSDKIPSVIVANTVKGKGVKFAEDEAIWHYRSLSKELYEDAIAGLNGAM